MRILIAEDDFASRKLMMKLLSSYGECDVAANGKEALDVYREALKAGSSYQLVCLDIMMPEMDGHDVLKQIRSSEREHGLDLASGAKVIMTTALTQREHFSRAFKEDCAGYLVKPIQKEKLVETLKLLGLHA